MSGSALLFAGLLEGTDGGLLAVEEDFAVEQHSRFPEVPIPAVVVKMDSVVRKQTIPTPFEWRVAVMPDRKMPAWCLYQDADS